MPDSEQAPIRRKLPLALTFFSLLAVGGLVSMPVLAGSPGGKELPDMARFIGHFHPLLLHLPIGVFSLILFQELGAIFGGRGKESRPSSLFPMFFGAASAISAVIAGFLLYHSGGSDYADNPIAERHLWGGLAFAVASVITFVLKAWSAALPANPAWYRMMFFASMGIMVFASHDGGSITHGEGYLTQYAPPALKKLLGQHVEEKPKAPVSKPAAEQVVYADIIAPILERRCVSCHKEGKSKGNLRMDTYELLIKGGKEGHDVIPGDVAKSNILVRMQLPKDDDDHMPPEGKPAVTDEELKVIKWWIASGADPLKKLTEIETPEDIKGALAKLTHSAPAAGTTPDDKGHPVAPNPVAKGPDEGLKSSVAQLSKQFPGAISFESQESPLVTFTAVSLRGKFDDEMFGKLGPVLPKLVTLDLSATKITDKSVAGLTSATNLKMVRLAETGVTDSSIDPLLKIPSLESINIYGTKVTDAGVMKLATLPNLKRLYLWQTAVTPDAVKALKEKMPKCEIITGS